MSEDQNPFLREETTEKRACEKKGEKKGTAWWPRPAGQPGGPEFRPTFFCVFFSFFGAPSLSAAARALGSAAPLHGSRVRCPQAFHRTLYHGLPSQRPSHCNGVFVCPSPPSRSPPASLLRYPFPVPPGFPPPTRPPRPRWPRVRRLPTRPLPNNSRAHPPLLRAVIRVGSRRPDTEGTSPSVAILAQAGGSIVAARCHWMHASTKPFRTSLLSSCTTMARTMSHGLLA